DVYGSAENQTSVLRAENAGSRMPQRGVGGQAFILTKRQPRGEAVHLGTVPLDREEDGSSKEVVQVKGVASVLPEVVAIEDQMRPQSLFQASVVHVANSRYKRHARVRAENIGRQAAGAR